MPETIEINFYEFIRSELSALETRMNVRSAEIEARTEKRFAEVDGRFVEMDSRTEKRLAEMEARTDKRFDKLEEEVRWPRRIATAGVITTVVAVGFALAGFAGR